MCDVIITKTPNLAPISDMGIKNGKVYINEDSSWNNVTNLR